MDVSGESAVVSESNGQDLSSINLFNEESGGEVAQASAPVASSKADQELSKRLEFLSRKERDLMARERKYKEQLDRYKQYETSSTEYENLKQIANEDPLALLDKFGLDMDKLTSHVMQRNDGLSYQEKQQLLDRIEKQEKRFEELELKNKQKELTITYGNYISDLKEVAAKDPERWELVVGENAYETAFAAANQYFKDKGVMVDHEEALDTVEQYLDQLHSKGLKYKKVQKRFGQTIGRDTESLSQQPNSQQSYMEPKTLTNNFASSTPSISNKYMTPQESKDMLAKMMGNSLWNE